MKATFSQEENVLYSTWKNTIKHDHDFYLQKSPQFFRQITVFTKVITKYIVDFTKTYFCDHSFYGKINFSVKSKFSVKLAAFEFFCRFHVNCHKNSVKLTVLLWNFNLNQSYLETSKKDHGVPYYTDKWSKSDVFCF